MAKEIKINAFVAFSPSHLSPGLWAHPEDRSLEYNTLRFWTDLAQTAERGLYDGLFWADGISAYDVYRGSHDTGIRLGVQFPRLDPLVLVSAVAQATKHIGLAITSSVSYEAPYLFARRMSSLDHLTDGRIGWNIVTSFGDSGSRSVGQQRALPHDERYDVADEYMEVVYKLWEGSWEDGAAVRDRETVTFADPSKVHAIRHRGKYFELEGTHYSEPSRQRTPLLYQAGSSGRGKAFAARHAECVFLSAPSRKIIRDEVADIRRRAALAGRDPSSVLFFSLATVIVGRTEAEARAKFDDITSRINLDGALALLSRWTGQDLSKQHPDEPLRYAFSQGMQSTIEGFTIADPDRVWTISELALHNAIGGKGPVIVGSPEQVADELQAWVEETDVDGFNLSHALLPGTHRDFVDLVVPELQRRSVYKTAYRTGSLREKLFARDTPRLPSDHPGASFRDAWAAQDVLGAAE